MKGSLYSVITTIQNPTGAVRQLLSKLHGFGAKLIVIGDKKGPASYELDGTEFLSLNDQLGSTFELGRKLVKEKFFPEQELELVNTWLADLEKARK